MIETDVRDAQLQATAPGAGGGVFPRADQRSGAATGQDLSAGQIIIIVARWILIATGLAITLWSPAEHDLQRIKISIFVLLGLAFCNFYIHAQVLMRRPVPRGLLYGASAVDIAIITLITWQFGGIGAPMFVFYFPAVLAFALVFPLSITVWFTLALVGAYTVASLPLKAEPDLQALVARGLAFVAVATIGNIYQRIERERREAFEPEESLPEPSGQFRTRTATEGSN